MKNHRLESIGQRSGFTLIELVVVLGIIAVLTTMLMPFLGKGIARARSTHCLNNLRQLGVAVHAYASDYNNKLPLAEAQPSNPVDPANPLPRIRDLLANYAGPAGDATIFKCPNDSVRFSAEGCSYEWAYVFGGQDIDRLQVMIFTLPPSKAPIMYDYDAVHLDRGGSGTRNVLYADGHVGPL